MICPYGNGPSCRLCRCVKLHSWYWLALVIASIMLVAVAVGGHAC